MGENAITNAQPEGAAAPRKSFVARMGGVLFSPGATFEDIARAPDFIAPLVAFVVVSYAVTEIALDKVGATRIVQFMLNQRTQDQQLTADQLQRAAATSQITLRLGAVIGSPIFLLIVAAIGILILNAFFGSDTKFGPVFSVTCYAFLPEVIAGLLAIPVALFGDPEQFNIQNPAPTNPGFFMNPLETSKPLYALASALNPFALWVVFLLAIGLSRLTRGKAKTSWIFGCFLGVWAIGVLARVGIAMMF